MSEKPTGLSYGETMLFGGLGLIFLVKLFEKFYLWFGSSLKNQLMIYGIATAILTPLVIVILFKIRKLRKKNLFEKGITGKEHDSVYCGKSDKNEDVWIKPRQRSMHTQVIGTTNAGKTESVILPWAIQDIHSGKGLLLIDGKADNSLLDKLWSYSKLAKREKDFKLFSLSRREESLQFNPLIGGTAEEITERVFNAFEFDNSYYKSLQYEVMSQVMRIFESSQTIPTFQRLYQAISKPKTMEEIITRVDDPALRQWFMHYLGMSQKERDERTSGLLTAFSHFSFGENAKLFNPKDDAITIDEALRKNQIVYFQLPVLLSPFLGRATGKLILQSLQAAIANRHRGSSPQKFFSVFLDDFSEYLFEGFVTILNKSRSANVGVVFAHQALRDIKVLGDSVTNSILTNANLKIFMRGNDPESAEYFSKVIGTETTTKTTERQKKDFFGTSKSGEMSARAAEEFVVNPNEFKRSLGVGEAMMVIPHERGTKTIRIKFNKLDDLPRIELPKFQKHVMPLIEDVGIKNRTLPKDTVDVFKNFH